MLDRSIRKLVDVPLDGIAKILGFFSINPNVITVFGFVLGLVGVGFTMFSFYWVGLAFVLCNRLLDGLDGAIAREQEKSSAVGGYLDIVLDFIFYSAVPLGFGLANLEQNGFSAMVLIFSFVGTGSSFLAYAIFIEKFNVKETDVAHAKKSFVYAKGLMEGSETIFAFVLFYLFPNHFWWLALVVAFLCFITAISRIYFTCLLLQEKEKTL